MAPLESFLGGAAEHRKNTGRPLVTLSYAQSLDGSLSRARGVPTALSGPQSQEMTHRLRAAHDAILVGIGTVISDDPQLNVRLADGPSPQPIVVDSHLRLPHDSQLLQQDPAPWVFCVEHTAAQAQSTLQETGARVIPLAADREGRVSLPALLEVLGDEGVERLMVEGGAGIITSFLTQGLVDLAAVTIAPIFLGGLNAVEHLMAEKSFPRIIDPVVERYGDDIVISGRVQRA